MQTETYFQFINRRGTRLANRPAQRLPPGEATLRPPAALRVDRASQTRPLCKLQFALSRFRPLMQTKSPFSFYMDREPDSADRPAQQSPPGEAALRPSAALRTRPSAARRRTGPSTNPRERESEKRTGGRPAPSDVGRSDSMRVATAHSRSNPENSRKKCPRTFRRVRGHNRSKFPVSSRNVPARVSSGRAKTPATSDGGFRRTSSEDRRRKPTSYKATNMSQTPHIRGEYNKVASAEIFAYFFAPWDAPARV